MASYELTLDGLAARLLSREMGAGALFALAVAAVPSARAIAQQEATRAVLLVPARVFDGVAARPHDGWAVLVHAERIEAVGPRGQLRVPADAATIDLPGATLLAGFTTLRDLGTEGAGYADVGLKQAIEQGIIPGPRILATTKAIVATGSYGPKGFDPEFRVPQGAEEADGVDGLTRVVRDQIGKGADWIKVYADYRWGPRGEARPTFTLDELKLIVEVARSSGRPVVAHASTADAMSGDTRRRADNRARRQRDPRRVPASGAERDGSLPNRRGRRCDPPLPRVEARRP